MRPHRPRSVAPPLHVTIVSNNPETLDGLQAYFQRAGVGAHGTRRIASPALVQPSSSAVVLFPDDFGFDEVVDAITQLRRLRPEVLSIVVTRHPRRFESLDLDDRSALVVIAKPAWGWTILDTIRGHLPAPP